ncbi:MAG: glycosyltransferase family 2 protein [Chitinophagaceae bacterium]|nr:glycosyltransferase family 2 protein [Chitinophagaceae bacterium]
MNNNVHISIISPVYNASEILNTLIERIIQNIELITDSYEIILVEDGGSDNSWEVIKDAAKLNSKIKACQLSRNFGQHYAITAGIDISDGDWLIIMDCDLQDRPEEIINLYQKANEGFDIVLARREFRKDTKLKKIYSLFFYRILGYLTGTNQDETIGNFGIYNSKVIREIKKMNESIRYFPTMIKWVGFNTTAINVKHSLRNSGKSAYNFKKMLNLAIDIILAYSDKPIRLIIKLGLVISLISFFLSIFTFYKWIIGDIQVSGYSSLIISIWFLSGFIITTLGLVGLYIGKIFEGVKKRPLYIINNTINI